MQIRIELDGDLRTLLEAIAELHRMPVADVAVVAMLAGVSTFTAVQEIRDDAPAVLFFGLTRVVELVEKIQAMGRQLRSSPRKKKPSVTSRELAARIRAVMAINFRGRRPDWRGSAFERPSE